MNKSFEIIDGKIIVINEHSRITERECVNNIEDRLITENNIEEIENLINKKKSQIDFDKKAMRTGHINIFNCLLWMTLCILNLLANNTFSAVCNMICAGCWGTSAALTIVPKTKMIKQNKAKIVFLEKSLLEEIDKLNELQKNNSNNAKCIVATKKKLSTSTKITILKNRLNDIELYRNHKHKIIKLYKKGLLEEKLFEGCASRDTINFIMELAKNDVNAENITRNNKTKKKTHDIDN